MPRFFLFDANSTSSEASSISPSQSTTTISDSSYQSSDTQGSSSHFWQISIEGEELSPVSSTHPSPSNSMESVSNDETFWASLHSTIVNYIDILLDERQIGVPDGWSTYEILEHLVVNDENLFRDPSFLGKMIIDLSLSLNPCWFDRGFYSINTLTSRKGMMENSIGAGGDSTTGYAKSNSRSLPILGHKCC